MNLVAFIGLGIAIVALVLRMVSRAVGDGTFWQNTGLDDAFILATMFPVVGISACAVIRELCRVHLLGQ